MRLRPTKVKAATFQKEYEAERQKFFKDDRVRHKKLQEMNKGTVIRKAVGGYLIDWDNCPDPPSLHNPRYLENVWIDPETGEEEE